MGSVNSPFGRTDDGRYVSVYKRCECGVEYLDKDSHERENPRHKQWLKGDIEVPVPEQPPSGSFPVDGEPPRLVLGETVICGRCKGKKAKGEQFCYDPRQKERRCLRCNGWGIVPNQGPIGAPKRA